MSLFQEQVKILTFCLVTGKDCHLYSAYIDCLPEIQQMITVLMYYIAYRTENSHHTYTILTTYYIVNQYLEIPIPTRWISYLPTISTEEGFSTQNGP